MNLQSLIAIEALVLPRKPDDGDLKKKRSGFMVALMVPREMEETVALAGGWDGGERSWEDPLHCTLSYVDDPAKNMAVTIDIVRRVVRKVPRFSMVTTRAGFFRPDDESLVHYVGVAAPELEALVAEIRWRLDRAGIEHDTKFPVYTPHVTLEYVENPSEDDLKDRLVRSVSAIPCKFYPTVSIVNDDEGTELPFSSEMASPAWQDRMDQASVTGESRLQEVDPVAGASALHKHMVRGVFGSLRKRGHGTKDAAVGAFKITGSVLKGNGMQGAGDTGRLTGSGAKRSKVHAAEPVGVKAAKAKDYSAIKKHTQ